MRQRRWPRAERVYLGPESAPISIPGLPDLHIYVLGPPRDKKLLQLEEKADEMYRLAARAAGRSNAR